MLGFLNARVMLLRSSSTVHGNKKREIKLRDQMEEVVDVNSNDDNFIQAQQSDGKLHDDCYISSLSEESRNLSNSSYVDMVCFRVVVVAYICKTLVPWVASMRQEMLNPDNSISHCPMFG